MKWVLFDYGGVISSPPTPQDLAALAAAFDTCVPALVDAYWARRRDYDLAELTAEAYWQAVADRLGRCLAAGLTPELVRLDIASWLHLRPGTVRLVEALAASGRRLAVLSNAPQEMATAIAALPVARHFEHLLFSCQIGTAKPDQRCFRETLARLAAEPGDVILVDDRPDNVAAAARLGMLTIAFTGAGQAQAELRRLGCL